MIRNQWYVLPCSDEIESKPVRVTRMGEKMVFWRDRRGTIIDYFRNQEAPKPAVEEKVAR